MGNLYLCVELGFYVWRAGALLPRDFAQVDSFADLPDLLELAYLEATTTCRERFHEDPARNLIIDDFMTLTVCLRRSAQPQQRGGLA